MTTTAFLTGKASRLGGVQSRPLGRQRDITVFDLTHPRKTRQKKGHRPPEADARARLTFWPHGADQLKALFFQHYLLKKAHAVFVRTGSFQKNLDSMRFFGD